MKNTNLLGISGKIGSGKDTVGKIIQILTSFPKMTTERVVAHLDKDLAISKYKIKKFADKLKDIVCILIGCTREQLEDSEFKETELREEWWIIKNKEFGTLLAYSDLDYNQQEYYPVSYELIKPTPRLLLQLIGTQCGRQIIHPNIWVNALFSGYKLYDKGKAHDLIDWSELYTHMECERCKKSYNGYKRQIFCKECIEDDTFQIYPNWIITDMRFPNELKVVEDRKGITIRVNRDVELRFPDLWKDFQNSPEEYDEWDVYLKEHGMFEIVYHESETALDNATFDHIIDNNSSIEDLIEKVREILIKEEII